LEIIESTLNGSKGTKVQINLKTTGVPADFATTRDGMKLEDVYTNYLPLH
jgi:C-terminal processing protease CtpA/Prc